MAIGLKTCRSENHQNGDEETETKSCPILNFLIAVFNKNI